MFKIALNTRKPDNYAFFCPVSRLNLTVSSPVGFANEVTTAILRGLRAKTILDVDGVIDITTGTVKAASTEQEKASESPQTPVNNEVPPQNEEPKDAEDTQKTEETPVIAPENGESEVKTEDAPVQTEATGTEEKPKKSRSKKAEAEEK